jgi:hypothetical protein
MEEQRAIQSEFSFELEKLSIKFASLNEPQRESRTKNKPVKHL